MTTVNDDDDTEFTRRRFTLPESLNVVLTRLAENHYQGNVSLCLRAAIEDHRTTVEGNKTELMLQQVTRRLTELETQQTEIQTSLANLVEEVDSDDQSFDSYRAGMQKNTSETMSRIHISLREAEQPLRMDDLTEELDSPAVRIEPVLGRMVDQGRVIVNRSNPQRFSLPGKHNGEFQ